MSEEVQDTQEQTEASANEVEMAARAAEAAAQDANQEPQGTDTRDQEGQEEQAPEEQVAPEEPAKDRADLVGEAVRPLLNKKPGGSYRVAKHGVVTYLKLLKNPEFSELWAEKVTGGKEGPELEDALKAHLESSRISLPEVKAKGDELVKDEKPKGVWLKGLIACALADLQLPPEPSEEDVAEVRAEVAEIAPEVPAEEAEAERQVAEEVAAE
jgi:hypothetical protein